MTNLTRTATLIATLVASALGADAIADSIVLRSSVRLPAGVTEVRLRDVAHLDGDSAMRLADTRLADLGASASVELPLEEVRAKLVAVTSAANLIDFSGKAVLVRTAAAGRPVAMKGLALEPGTAPREAPEGTTESRAVARVEFFADEATDLRTPRGLIAELIGNAHAKTGARVRIIVTGTDAAFLDQVSATRRFEVLPLGSLTGDKVRMRVLARDGDVVVGRTELIVLTTLEAHVATVTDGVRRGQALGDAVEVRTEFVAPSEFRSLPPDDAAIESLITTDRLKKGDRITDDKIRQPIQVRKNDKVTIRRELGTMAVELTAIAEEDGAAGDVIRFRAIDRKDRRDRRTFTAEITGPGRAVIRDGAPDTTRTLAKDDA